MSSIGEQSFGMQNINWCACVVFKVCMMKKNKQSKNDRNRKKIKSNFSHLILSTSLKVSGTY